MNSAKIESISVTYCLSMGLRLNPARLKMSLMAAMDHLWEAGQWEVLCERMQGILAEAKKSHDADREAEAWSALAFLHGVLGNKEEAVRSAQAALRIRLGAGDPVQMARALAGLGAGVATQDGIREALCHLQGSLDAYRGAEAVEERCYATVMYAQVLMGVDRHREARDLLEESLSLCREDSMAWCRWLVLETLSEVAQALQDLPSAIRHLEEAFVCRQHEEAVTVAGLRRLSELYALAGRAWEAQEMLRMAVEKARETGQSACADQAQERLRATSPRVARRSARLTARRLKLPAGERSH